MEEIVKFDLTEREAQGLRELIADCVQKMKQAHEAMALDEIEIARMQAETREILAREWKGGVSVEGIAARSPRPDSTGRTRIA